MTTSRFISVSAAFLGLLILPLRPCLAVDTIGQGVTPTTSSTDLLRVIKNSTTLPGDAGRFELNLSTSGVRALYVLGNGTGPAFQSDYTGSNAATGTAGLFQSLALGNTSPALRALASGGDGVFGQSNTGYGIHGCSATTFGVYGESKATSGFASGVYGISQAGTGVSGNTVSGLGGVYGSAATGTAGAFDSIGGYGLAVSGGGNIVALFNRSGTSNPQIINESVFQGSADFGRAIVAVSQGTNAHSLALAATATGPGGAAYFGTDSASITPALTVTSGATGAQAALFNGAVQVIGSFSSSNKYFKIDHPLDPANRYLYHSVIESPEMMTMYTGNVTTDKSGSATAALPSYFEALNTDFRYQLTVIGQFSQAIVEQEVRDNQFVIRTDKPNVRVSWQVTGVR